MQVPNICAHLGEGVSKSQWNGGGEEEVGKSQDKHQDIPAQFATNSLNSLSCWEALTVTGEFSFLPGRLLQASQGNCPQLKSSSVQLYKNDEW